jgi:hypothetical protein
MASAQNYLPSESNLVYSGGISLFKNHINTIRRRCILNASSTLRFKPNHIISENSFENLAYNGYNPCLQQEPLAKIISSLKSQETFFTILMHSLNHIPS